MSAKPVLPIVQVADQQSWADWLEQNHADLDGVWLKLAKKASKTKTVTYAQAVEAALCFGWLDGQVRRLDERFYLQRFTPRGARSQWSQLNCEKATRLLEQGRMKPAGLGQVEAAEADGRWGDGSPWPFYSSHPVVAPP